ncbi:TetR-like C-terminal domain-containing protein [Nonomuraea spiralis]|uniref:TetR-like C-terminal domain-containing protein n=1 Tax=Nonomuraea spiralis TaxID=46182 RepID=A0ABV5ILH3_9ACTN|nr:TetR-like C-terminal domain-containing protein [Nonomuraea spiralis]
MQNTLAFDDTTSVREDLRRQLHSFAEVMGTPGGRALRQLIGQSQTDGDLATAYRALYSSGRRELAYWRLAPAQDIGEIRADVDALVDNLFDGIAPR